MYTTSMPLIRSRQFNLNLVCKQQTYQSSDSIVPQLRWREDKRGAKSMATGTLPRPAAPLLLIAKSVGDRGTLAERLDFGLAENHWRQGLLRNHERQGDFAEGSSPSQKMKWRCSRVLLESRANVVPSQVNYRTRKQKVKVAMRNIAWRAAASVVRVTTSHLFTGKSQPIDLTLTSTKPRLET